ncbi:GNAT family N-acetyltransferase [Beutenbergia cavernae]|uniref:GNAT family N-acetyltransferase n=1 Tax=Beutenbergia cavernae TaxID=84757 RepID=UPI00019AD9DD|nr:GNAT family N-acetyltransferase [Beutenbergia cavernae]
MANLPEGYEASFDAARLDVERVHTWLSEDSYWARGRARETQEAAIAGSLNLGVYESATGEQVAYARIVTDGATFGWLCDVYVARRVRGLGIGTALVRLVREEGERLGLRRIVLATADAHAVYATAGFAPLEDPSMWMALQLR